MLSYFLVYKIPFSFYVCFYPLSLTFYQLHPLNYESSIFSHLLRIHLGSQGCILSPCLFNLYTEYIMRNAGLEEAQAGIKLTGRNLNNLRYAYDTTLMAENKELEPLDESERGE